MSSRSRLAVVLTGIVAISALFYSTSRPHPTQLDGQLNAAVVTPQLGQNSDLPRPVKKFSNNPRSAEIELFSFEFERPYLGREGPNFTELEGEPSAGAEYLATAELFREEAVSTAKFELVDEEGRTIQPLYFYKRDNSLEFAKFFGSAKIPDRPFRVAVSGVGIDGQQYRSVFERLFRPTRQAPAPPLCRVSSRLAKPVTSPPC